MGYYDNLKRWNEKDIKKETTKSAGQLFSQDSEEIKEKPKITVESISPEAEEQKKVLDSVKSKMPDEPKHFRSLKLILLLIPVLLILYLLVLNFAIPRDFNYFHDLSEDSSVLSPESRISRSEESVSMISNLVYFNAKIPRSAETISIESRFSSEFPESYDLKIGAKDREDWHYLWKTLYNPVLADLSEYSVSPGVYSFSDFPYATESEILSQNDLVIASNLPLEQKSNAPADFQEINLDVSTALRGAHTLVVYLNNSISLSVEKRDLNWYNGSDPLTITLLDSSQNVIQNFTLPDDSIIDASRVFSEPISSEFSYPTNPGVYFLEFSDFDGLVTNLKINSNKLVVKDRIYLANSPIFSEELQENSKIYTLANRPSEISVKTWHESALQPFFIDSNIHFLYEVVNSTSIPLSSGFHSLSSNYNDIIVETPGYFSFSEESYFEPFNNRIVPIRNSKDFLENNVDYLITDYTAPEISNGFVTSKVTFNISDLYIDSGSLSLVFNAPHLNSESYSNSSLEIDYLNITVHKPSIIK